jgi:hypothetical protein
MSTLLTDEERAVITPESDLGKALVARGLFYNGDRPRGFIEGWEAARAHYAPETERLRTALEAITTYGLSFDSARLSDEECLRLALVALAPDRSTGGEA